MSMGLTDFFEIMSNFAKKSKENVNLIENKKDFAQSFRFYYLI